ncbi:unnamed protein product, partial [Coregonus sp. 'balchen']
MAEPSWIGLSDIQTEAQWVWTDGTPADFLPWAPNQPDNWQGNEDCAHVRETPQAAPGRLNDEFCPATLESFCKK